ncbi:MAG: hypothetical protein ACTSPN_15980, partial [Promethearchaeota archaeon]
QMFLGLTLAAILYLIIYSSIGLNYFGFVPSITKAAWIPVYFIMATFIFIFYGLFFQMVIQSKFGNHFKNLCKLSLLFFCFVFLYILIYMFVLSTVIRTFYYFGFIVPLTIPVFLLMSFVWSINNTSVSFDVICLDLYLQENRKCYSGRFNNSIFLYNDDRYICPTSIRS